VLRYTDDEEFRDFLLSDKDLIKDCPVKHRPVYAFQISAAENRDFHHLEKIDD